MTAAFVLGQNVNLALELGVRVNRARLGQNLTALDVGSLDTTEQNADVVASLSKVEELAEHFDARNNGLSSLVGEADDFDFVRHLQNATLNSTGSNSTTAGDGEDVLNRHQERLVSLTFRGRDVVVNSIHQVEDALVLRSVDVLGLAGECEVSGTLDDRGVIARELILVQQVTDLHLNKLEELFVVNLVALVHEYNNVRNTNLTGEEDVLTGLRHRAVSSGNDEDSAVHLCSTGDHVLNIVSMARAVNVSVVTLVRLILNVSGVDRDTTLSLFRSLIDHGVILELCLALQSENLRDSSSKSSLTMVNVTDCTDVYMGLISFELSLCHWNCLLLFSKITF